MSVTVTNDDFDRQRLENSLGFNYMIAENYANAWLVFPTDFVQEKYSTIYYSRAYELNLYKGVVSYSPPPSQ